ncbi:hypothetical protein LZ30DRAFT_690827 [Colletotrichum cereale]|nr:hypothetical protein LZ30DRAFT_690827 [Colletotrichum cereale]
MASRVPSPRGRTVLVTMLLYYLSVYYFAVAAALVFPPSPARISNPGRQVRSGPINTAKAWKSIKELVPSGPKPGRYYYFMSCTLPDSDPFKGQTEDQMAVTKFVIKETGCKHVGLVIGRTAQEKDRFSALYFHLQVKPRKDDEGGGPPTLILIPRRTIWESPNDNQEIRWGGETTSAQADVKRLRSLSLAWLDLASDFTMEYNCLTYYWYLAQNI